MIVGFGLVNKDIVAVVPAWERGSKARATRTFEQIGGPVPVALTAVAKLGGSANLRYFTVFLVAFVAREARHPRHLALGLAH